MSINYKFRTVTNQVFNLQVDPNMTVFEVKQALEKQTSFPAENIKMIASAHVLNDEQQFKDLNIKPESTIVIHCARKTAPPAAPPAQTPTPAPAPQPTPTPAPQPTPQPAPQPIQPQPVPQPRPMPVPQPNPQPYVPQGDPADFQQKVAMLVDMGFDKTLSENALRMSNYSPDEAANILLSGEGAPGGGFGGQGAPSGDYDYPGAASVGSFGAMQSSYDSLSENEKASVQHLIQTLGIDGGTVLQVYFACDKDETQTSSCLQSML